jgi:hypothetical protein
VNFHAFSGLLNGLAATISGILVYAKKQQQYGGMATGHGRSLLPMIRHCFMFGY